MAKFENVHTPEALLSMGLLFDTHTYIIVCVRDRADHEGQFSADRVKTIVGKINDGAEPVGVITCFEYHISKYEAILLVNADNIGALTILYGMGYDATDIKCFGVSYDAIRRRLERFTSRQAADALVSSMLEAETRSYMREQEEQEERDTDEYLAEIRGQKLNSVTVIA